MNFKLNIVKGKESRKRKRNLFEIQNTSSIFFGRYIWNYILKETNVIPLKREKCTKPCGASLKKSNSCLIPSRRHFCLLLRLCTKRLDKILFENGLNKNYSMKTEYVQLSIQSTHPLTDSRLTYAYKFMCFFWCCFF